MCCFLNNFSGSKTKSAAKPHKGSLNSRRLVPAWPGWGEGTYPVSHAAGSCTALGPERQILRGDRAASMASAVALKPV